jgi:hypothetical protein
MGRNCTVCASGPDVRHEVDRLIVEGQSFRAIERRFENLAGLSRDSIRRHFLHHASADVLAALQESGQVDGPGLVLRLLEVADDAQRIRRQLVERGQTMAALKAGDHEARVLGIVTQRIGITDETLAANVQQADDLIRSLVHVMREHPDLALGELLLAELRDRGSTQMADALASLNDRISKKELK